MRAEQRLELIETWITHMKLCDAQYEAMNAAIGLTVEGPLTAMIDRFQTALTKAVALAVGDEEKWLEWFWHENEYGKRAFECSVDVPARNGWKKLTCNVRTARQLLAIIDASRKANGHEVKA